MLTENYLRFYSSELTDNYIITNSDCYEADAVGDVSCDGIQMNLVGLYAYRSSELGHRECLQEVLDSSCCDLSVDEFYALLRGEASAWKVTTIAVDDNSATIWVENEERITHTVIFNAEQYNLSLKARVRRRNSVSDLYELTVSRDYVMVDELDPASTEGSRIVRRSLEFVSCPCVMSGLEKLAYMAYVTEHH